MCRIENEDIRAFQKRSTTSCDYSKHWLKEKAACPRSPQAKFGMIRVLGIKSQSATTAREIDPRKRFVADSPLEGDGVEPSVPRQIFSAARRSPRKFTCRNINRLPRASRILARADIALQRGCPGAHPSRNVMRDVKFADWLSPAPVTMGAIGRKNSRSRLTRRWKKGDSLSL